jgi:hypothetical protein
VQDKTRLDKSNRRYCFYTSNSFLHVGTAHFSFDEMRTQTSGIQERSKDRNRSVVIGLKINSYRQDFPFIFLLIFGFRFQIKSSCSLKSPLESSASVPTLTHLSGVDPHYGPLFRNEIQKTLSVLFYHFPSIGFIYWYHSHLYTFSKH